MAIHEATIGLPERFDLEEGGGTLRIRWKWPRIAGVFIIFFAIAWDSFLVGWYFNAASRGQLSLFELLFPLAHVAVGLFLPYLALATLLNETSVEVGKGEVTIAHRPLPWPGGRTLRVSDVRQLFCVERRARKGAVSYSVMARLTSDREVTLVSGLADDREARFLEQRIEARLGLPNQPMSGELPR